MRKPSWLLVSCLAAALPSTAAWSTPSASDQSLFFSAAECWLGGVWGDAVGRPEAARKDATEASCQAVASTVWGAADSSHMLQLRAIEKNAVDDVASRLRGDADLVATFNSFAAAQRENMLARRAADRIKLDIDGTVRSSDKFTTDESDAIAPFRAQDGVTRLLASKQRDAHALAIISAMDRMELSRGLPRHMKIYALAAPYGALFGVRVKLPERPTLPAVRGAWLGFLTDTAKAAGHAVPAGGTPRHRNALAWGGVLEGLADQLRPELDRVSPELRPVVEGTIRRLQAEYTSIRNGDHDGEDVNW